MEFVDIYRFVQNGIQYERAVAQFLRSLTINAEVTSATGDNGIDIVAKAKLGDSVETYYIQCKYYNKPLGKSAVQEVYTGTHYYDESSNAHPVVITNNKVTVEARIYARKLGVEVIGDSEWREVGETEQTKKISNPNIHTGLLGLMLSKLANDREYVNKILASNGVIDTEYETKKVILEVKNTFEEAEECLKEANYLHDKANKYSQRALSLQKEAVLKNLEYS